MELLSQPEFLICYGFRFRRASHFKYILLIQSCRIQRKSERRHQLGVPLSAAPRLWHEGEALGAAGLRDYVE